MTIKRPLYAAIAAAAVLGCSCTDKQKLEQAQAANDTLTQQLQQTVATQDSLFALINDISEGVAQIKDLEQIISTPGLSESPSRKQQLRSDMIAIQQSLKQRRERLAELEAQLKQSNNQNSNLTRTITNLRAQIAEQETEISTLANHLAEANIHIAELTQQVDSISTVAGNEAQARAEAEAQNVELNNELNTCFYAIGTKSELKQNGIIETGFLRSTKVLKGDFNSSYFTRADMRTLTEIPLHSNKAEVLTTQPKNSYEIVDVNGQKTLRITDPTRFWHLTNMLVVKVD